MKPYVAAPPAGVSAPPLWGSEQHVLALFGDRLTDVRTERRGLPVDSFGDGEGFCEYFKANYGPTIAAYRGLGEDRDRIAALDVDIARLANDALNGSSSMEWEYLLVVARTR
jgi:hypothetical protein